MNVYIIYHALISAALLGVGGEADSPTIVYLMCLSLLDSALMVFFIFTIRISPPCMFACADFSAVSDLENIEGYSVEGYFEVFFQARFLFFTPQIPLGSPLFSLEFFLFISDFLKGSFKVV